MVVWNDYELCEIFDSTIWMTIFDNLMFRMCTI